METTAKPGDHAARSLRSGSQGFTRREDGIPGAGPSKQAATHVNLSLAWGRRGPCTRSPVLHPQKETDLECGGVALVTLHTLRTWAGRDTARAPALSLGTELLKVLKRHLQHLLLR